MFRMITISLFVLSFSATTFAASPVKLSENEKVRKAIDNICGDTWCEGDYQFNFNQVTFNKKTVATTVTFTMSPYLDDAVVGSTDAFEATIGKTSFAVKCVIKGFSDPDLIAKENGSLNEGFYSALNDCINSVEDQLNKRF